MARTPVSLALKRGYTIKIENFSRKAGTGLTPQEPAMIEEAEKCPQVYDDDCPKLTAEQLAEFQPAIDVVLKKIAKEFMKSEAYKKHVH